MLCYYLQRVNVNDRCPFKKLPCNILISKHLWNELMRMNVGISPEPKLDEKTYLDSTHLSINPLANLLDSTSAAQVLPVLDRGLTMVPGTRKSKSMRHTLLPSRVCWQEQNLNQ